MNLTAWLEREEGQFHVARVTSLLAPCDDRPAWTRLVDDHGRPLGAPTDRAAFYASSRADLDVLRSLNEHVA